MQSDIEKLKIRLTILEAKFIDFEEFQLESRYGPVQIVPEGQELKMTELKGGTR